MGYLINAWNETQKTFTMSLKQVVSVAGDGSLECVHTKASTIIAKKINPAKTASSLS